MALTEKQAEYLQRATHRWNFKVGAARSGKTYCDFFTIPMRIRALKEEGIVLLMGYTVGTLCRNLLDPMRQIWGEELVSGVGGKSDSVMLFGRKCYLLGADKVTAVERLQGSSIIYCYGDEVSTWSEEVFSMLKSRLDKPGACFDGTCNPSHPTHWLKRFLDSGADLFVQTYVIDDNPNLSPAFVENLKQEYRGTVWYDRLILGKWVAAEGVIYRDFAASPERFLLDEEAMEAKKPNRIAVGVDFGGTRSGTSFVAVGFTAGFREVLVLRSVRFFGEVDSEELSARFLDFARALIDRWDLGLSVFCDSAEPILIRSLRSATFEADLPIRIRKAKKGAVRDRIRLTLTLMTRNRFFLSPSCASLSEALCGAVWDPREVSDVRLDNGTSDVDSLDAMEYAMEPFAAQLIESRGRRDC